MPGRAGVDGDRLWNMDAARRVWEKQCSRLLSTKNTFENSKRRFQKHRTKDRSQNLVHTHAHDSISSLRFSLCVFSVSGWDAEDREIHKTSLKPSVMV